MRIRATRGTMELIPREFWVLLNHRVEFEI